MVLQCKACVCVMCCRANVAHTPLQGPESPESSENRLWLTQVGVDESLGRFD